MKDKKILIIEDEFHISEAIKLNLEILGAKCSVASDGTMGIDQWSNDKFDLIILDIMLPLMDGISVLKRIRSVDTQIPVVILSAKSDVEDRILGLENKADDYLGKPFNLKELLLRCEVLLKRKNLRGSPLRLYSSQSKIGNAIYLPLLHYTLGSIQLQCIRTTYNV